MKKKVRYFEWGNEKPGYVTTWTVDPDGRGKDQDGNGLAARIRIRVPVRVNETLCHDNTREGELT